MGTSKQRQARRAADADVRQAAEAHLGDVANILQPVVVTGSETDTDAGPRDDGSDHEDDNVPGTAIHAADSDSEDEEEAPPAKRAKPAAARLNFRNIVMRGFDPSRKIPIETFLNDFDRATRTYALLQGARWTDATLGAYLYEKLEGDAAMWASSCSPGWELDDYTATALKRHLLEQYSNAALESIHDVRVALSHMVKLKEQTWAEYGQSLTTAQNGYNVGQEFLVTCFERGLPREYAWACNSRDPLNISQAAKALEKFSRSTGVGIGGPDNRIGKTLSAVTMEPAAPVSVVTPVPAEDGLLKVMRTLAATVDMMAQRMPMNRGGRGGGRSANGNAGRGRGAGATDRSCWECQSPDHFRRDCPNWKPPTDGSVAPRGSYQKN
jgi:hypothetical protein